MQRQVTDMFESTDRDHYLELLHSHMNFEALKVNDIIRYDRDKHKNQQKTTPNQQNIDKHSYQYFQMQDKQQLPQISQAIILIKQNYESILKSKQLSQKCLNLKQILVKYYSHSLNSNPQQIQYSNEFYHPKGLKNYIHPLSILIQSDQVSLFRHNQPQVVSRFKDGPIFHQNLPILEHRLWIEVNKQINRVSVHTGDLQSVQNTKTIKLSQPLNLSIQEHSLDWKHCEKSYHNTIDNESSSQKEEMQTLTQNPLFKLIILPIIKYIKKKLKHDPFDRYLSFKLLPIETKKRPQLKQEPNILQYQVQELSSMPKQIQSLYGRMKNLDLLTLLSNKEICPNMTQELIQSSIHHSLVTGHQLLGEIQVPIGVLNHVLKMKTDQVFKEFTCGDIGKKSPKQINEKILNERVGYIRFRICCPKGCYPGSPAIMEIWPPFYCSPIHNHGKAFGLVKVLMGEIRVQNFQNLSLESQKEPYMKSSYSKGQYTWLSENSFGIHRVMNLHSQTSITLQGYYDHKEGLNEPFSFIHQNSQPKQKQFAIYYPQNDWQNYLNQKSIQNQKDKQFIDRVLQYYDLKDKQTGKIDCSYGKFICMLVKEHSAIKQMIDMK